jgi:hypothetical protein
MVYGDDDEVERKSRSEAKFRNDFKDAWPSDGATRGIVNEEWWPKGFTMIEARLSEVRNK